MAHYHPPLCHEFLGFAALYPSPSLCLYPDVLVYVDCPFVSSLVGRGWVSGDWLGKRGECAAEDVFPGGDCRLISHRSHRNSTTQGIVYRDEVGGFGESGATVLCWAM